MSRGPTFVDETAFHSEALTRRFGKVSAVTDVHLDVPQGAFLLLVGANGAGKSTLLSLFLDFLRPTSGELRVFGLDPSREGGRVRAAIGYVPEDSAWPWPDLTIGAYLTAESGYRTGWDPDYARHLAGLLDLRLDRRIRDASKGEFRRAQLLAALAHRPPALILDEPTDGLDPLMRDAFHELLGVHLSDSPCTVIVSSHLAHELEGYADHLAVMHRSRIVDVAARDDLRRDMRRIRLAPPAPDWSPPVLPRTRRFHRERRGHEESWTVWGPHVAVVETLERSGARVTDVATLTLEDAAVILLKTAASHGPDPVPEVQHA